MNGGLRSAGLEEPWYWQFVASGQSIAASYSQGKDSKHSVAFLGPLVLVVQLCREGWVEPSTGLVSRNDMGPDGRMRFISLKKT